MLDVVDVVVDGYITLFTSFPVNTFLSGSTILLKFLIKSSLFNNF